MSEAENKVIKAGQAVLDEAQDVMQEAEKLLHAAGDKGGVAMAQVMERLKKARQQLRGVEEAAVAKTKAAASATDSYVHDHPWRSIGVAAAVGVIIGMLIARK